MRSLKLQVPLVTLLTLFIFFSVPSDALAVIQNLNNATGQTQTFVNDSNITVTTDTNNNTHTFGWSGYLPISRGGTGIGSFTTGSVLFFNGTTLEEDNSNFFWDNVNKRLGVGTASPSAALEVAGSTKVNSLTSTNDATINGLTVGKGGGSDIYSTALGVSALSNNTTGSENTAIGFESLSSGSGGYYNTAVGFRAGGAGGSNTAIGHRALGSTTTGVRDTAIGYHSLVSNISGTDNTAVGTQTLEYNTTGQGNVALGFYALDSNTTGSLNTALGLAALGYMTSGDGNVAIGWHAGLTGITNANGNIYIGISSQGQNNDNNAIVIGPAAISAGSNKAVIGNSDMTDIYFGSSSSNADIHAQKAYLGNSSTPGCIIMGDSDGSGVTYLTVNDGVLSASTTAPTACQ